MATEGKRAPGKDGTHGAKRAAHRNGKSPMVLDGEQVRPPRPGQSASPAKPVYIRECVEYSDDSVEVRRVPGRGYGVFALRGFRPGELVLRLGGQVVYGKSYGSDYCMDLPPCPKRGPRSLEPNVPGGLLNHSCDPNCAMMTNSAGHAFLVAECCIEPDAELTFDYGYQFLGDAQIRCRCGSDRCRGWIIAAEHVPRLKRHFAAKRRNGRKGAV
ncbi:MAG: SET domain-containing protein-lysine N-methyltransferase [Planctomycetota bacterium]|nr:SET domain-containing protein-lysine N-methyltransferase [Planctomycetaceae bacterium]MDQ3332459.1 SET domain-containing protein-lysine N-methyltransferase [Planctomycetota bacterium]